MRVSSHVPECSTAPSQAHAFLATPPETNVNHTSDFFLAAIKAQAAENAERWAAYSRTPAEHLLILVEEVGEVARSMQGHRDHYLWPPTYTRWTVEELVDAGAVILAMLLCCPEGES